MNDMERRKFEDSFKDAFRDAEFTPSESVWTNVELDLEKASGNKMKRRILFYKLLAAASITFAMAAVGVNYYGGLSNQTQNTIAEVNGTKASSMQGEKSGIAKQQSEVNGDANKGSVADSQRQDDAGNDQGVSNDPSKGDTRNSVVTGSESKANDAAALADEIQLAKIASAKKDGGVAGEQSSTSIKDPSPAKETQKSSLASSETEAQRKLKPGVRSNRKDDNTTSVASNTKAGKVETDETANAADQSVGSQRKLRPRLKSGDQNTTDVASAETALDQRATVVNVANASVIGKHETIDNGSASKLASQEQQTKQNEVTAPIGGSAFSGSGYQDGLVSIQNSKLPPMVKDEHVEFVDPRKSTADPFQLMMARLNDQALAASKKGKDKKSEKNAETLWTSVAFAAGNFSTVNGRVSSSESNAFVVNSIANQQAKATGTAYSVGLSLGTKISERWVVQGGVNYMSQSSEYTASGLIGSADNSTFSLATVQQLDELFSAPKTAAAANAKYVPTASYGITSSLEFISVPMQAGYLVVNKKLGVQVNAGVSTDLFLQNTLAANGDGIKETTQGSGDDSPYRTVNFSGLFGTEVSYRLGTHYRLALNPGIRYPLNSIYKSDIGIEATPLTFDVGVKFRYIFR